MGRVLLESLTKPCVPDRIKLPQLLVTGVICEACSVNSVTSSVIRNRHVISSSGNASSISSSVLTVVAIVVAVLNAISSGWRISQL